MTSKIVEKRGVLPPRMEWYFDEIPTRKLPKRLIKENELKKPLPPIPRMEWYFDEIAQQGVIKCPVTGKRAKVEVIRSASRDNTPFVEVAYCSIFGCAPTCKKECLRQINFMKHFRK
jgi:hypothetical protein